MKITVTKFLEVRFGEPKQSAPSYVKLAPNSVIETDGVLHDGDAIDGNNKWYKDDSNNYYWSGAVTAVTEEANETPTVETANDSDSEKLDLSASLQQSITNLPNGNGDGITVAVLDSGINRNFPSLNAQIVKQKNYQDDVGDFPHGTQVAGFLVADNTELCGICTSAKLYDLRVADNFGNIINPAVVSALEDIYNWNETGDEFCDVINMSLNISPQFPNLQATIDKLVAQGVVILVAGTKGIGLNSVANLKGVIPIGTFKSYRFDSLKMDGFLPQLVVSYLNTPHKSTAIFPNYQNFDNSSAYTAMTSGIVSRFLSSNSIPKSERKEKVTQFLKSIALNIQQQSNTKQLTPYIS